MNQAPWTIDSLLRWATGYFNGRHIDSPRATAEILLAHGLGLERIDLYLRYDQPLTDDELKRFKALVQRRVRREPVAYIVGEKEFWGLSLAVSTQVLIPRPETECVVEAVLDRVMTRETRAPQRVLELGVGSGAITLALATERAENQYLALDRSLGALAVARENARRHGLDQRVLFFAGNWLQALSPIHGIDLIVANPPYIASEMMAALAPEITRYEPAGALDGGVDGLKDIRRIINEAPEVLSPKGHLVLEIGYDQGEAVKALAEAAGAYLPAWVGRDYSGHDRVVHLVADS